MPFTLLMFHGCRAYPPMASAIKHAARISQWQTVLMERREPSDDASGKTHRRIASSVARCSNTSPWCIPKDTGDTSVNAMPTLAGSSPLYQSKQEQRNCVRNLFFICDYVMHLQNYLYFCHLTFFTGCSHLQFKHHSFYSVFHCIMFLDHSLQLMFFDEAYLLRFEVVCVKTLDHDFIYNH